MDNANVRDDSPAPTLFCCLPEHDESAKALASEMHLQTYQLIPQEVRHDIGLIGGIIQSPPRLNSNLGTKDATLSGRRVPCRFLVVPVRVKTRLDPTAQLVHNVIRGRHDDWRRDAVCKGHLFGEMAAGAPPHVCLRFLALVALSYAAGTFLFSLEPNEFVLAQWQRAGQWRRAGATFLYPEGFVEAGGRPQPCAGKTQGGSLSDCSRCAAQHRNNCSDCSRQTSFKNCSHCADFVRAACQHPTQTDCKACVQVSPAPKAVPCICEASCECECAGSSAQASCDATIIPSPIPGGVAAAAQRRSGLTAS